MTPTERLIQARELCVFLHQFVGMLEAQLMVCHNLSRSAVDGVMHGITEISARTSEEKRVANEVLIRTYTHGDAETNGILNSAQDSVDSIFEAVQAGSLADALPENSKAPGNNAEDALRRSLGLFSKHMEALELLDGKLQQKLMDMMGVLSQDDVIAQRTEHVITGLSGLRALLAEIVANFDAACTKVEVERRTGDLLDATLRSFTTQDEKKLFKTAFPSMMRKAS